MTIFSILNFAVFAVFVWCEVRANRAFRREDKESMMQMDLAHKKLLSGELSAAEVTNRTLAIHRDYRGALFLHQSQRFYVRWPLFSLLLLVFSVAHYMTVN